MHFAIRAFLWAFTQLPAHLALKPVALGTPNLLVPARFLPSSNFSHPLSLYKTRAQPSVNNLLTSRLCLF